MVFFRIDSRFLDVAVYILHIFIVGFRVLVVVVAVDHGGGWPSVSKLLDHTLQVLREDR